MIWFNDFFKNKNLNSLVLGISYSFLYFLFITQFVQYLLADDAVAAFFKEIILFVKFSLVLPDGHIEALLLKVRLLLFTDGGLLQNLLDTQPNTQLETEIKLATTKHKWKWNISHISQKLNKCVLFLNRTLSSSQHSLHWDFQGDI